MGDSGAMLLGMLLAVATISGVGRNPTRRAAATSPPSRSRRWCRCWSWRSRSSTWSSRSSAGCGEGTGSAHADKEHIHHRLLDIGHGHRQAVLLMYLWSALIAASALAVA